MSASTSTTSAARAVAVVPTGWWGLADARGYYPDDLPRDWRLAYFANEHIGVYLPSAVWGAFPAVRLRSWQEEVHGRFGFFLQYPPQAVGAGARPEQARDALGDRLVAWVRWETGEDAPGALLDPSAPAPLGGGTRPSFGQAVHCPRALLADLRGGAEWLRTCTTAAAATLVVLPRPTAAQLGAWRQLAALLGFAELSAPPGRLGAST